MRAVVITYISFYGYPHLRVFSVEYKHLTDEKMIKKAKGWCKSTIRKKYDAGEVVITFYGDIMDITTAVNVPL